MTRAEGHASKRIPFFHSWGISLFTGMPCLVYAMRGQKYRTQQGAVPEMEQAQMGAFGIGVAAPLMRTLRRSIAARNGAGVR